MKILDAHSLSTISIKVSEEIEAKNLLRFLRTTILNSQLLFTKESCFSYYYNASVLTYEIVLYEKLSQDISIEPFLFLEKNKKDILLKVFITKTYFVITKNNQLLIFKKVNNSNKEEISSYIKEIYKIESFEIIQVSEDDIEELKLNITSNTMDHSYSLYPKKSFYLFVLFSMCIFTILLLSVYVTYYPQKAIFEEISTKKEISHFKNRDKVMPDTIELFKYIKLNKIMIEKVEYSNSRIKTTLRHKEKIHLLNFANIYSKTLQIKLLKFDEVEELYVMEIIIEY